MNQISSIFLFLTALLMLQSCTNDEIQEAPLNTTSVVITTHNTFLNAKNVNDPSIFGNIKDITVTATQTETGYQASTLFTISNNPNDSSTYMLKLVQEGINTFTATATSVTAATAPGFSGIPRNTTNSGVWNTIDAQVSTQPYATYTGSKGSTLIDVDTPTILNIPMKTNNGRFIAYFRGSTKNFYTTITPYIDEVPQATFIVSNINDFFWIWNDSDCVAGKKIRFQCITQNKGNTTKSTVNIPNVTIKNHTTSKYAYYIHESGDTYTTIPRN